MTLPEDILSRVSRVMEYHRASKYDSNLPKAAVQDDSASPPSTVLRFKQFPKVPLLTKLMDASTPALSVLENVRDAVPESQLGPPQNLKTLSTWLFMADGMIPVRVDNKLVGYERTCPSSSGTSPCEIYVAAFAIEGLEPGLYYVSSREYALRKIRDGYETLSLLKRGRPDLEFLKTTPGAILVSTVFSRSARRFGLRGYRHALQDAGQLLENVSVCGSALGIQTITRMRLTESTSRELIGVPHEAGFDIAESVQAMIVWADPANKPMPITDARRVVEDLAPLDRPEPSTAMHPYPQILAAHEDCVAPGMAVREVRPPLTELNPMPDDAMMIEKSLPEEPPVGQPIFRTLTTHRAARDFHRRSIPRDAFVAMNRAAFRGGSHFPLFPDGPYAALIRPFWIVHDVSGVDNGAWYYHPPADKWVALGRGDRRIETAYLAYEQSFAANASAVCFLMANLQTLLHKAGPDLYRLAHLEAGMGALRLYLAANALGLGCAPFGEFYDDDIPKFLEIEQIGWEPIHAAAIGISIDDQVARPAKVEVLDESDIWEG